MTILATLELDPPIVHRDNRGWLAELVRLDGSMGLRPGGQFFITTALPGKVKGNHYHRRKREVFCIIQSQAEMIMRPVGGGEYMRIVMGAAKLSRVLTIPGFSHAVVNRGTEEAVSLVYIDECYNPEYSDTYTDVVVNPDTLELQ
jgi:UDP-2-acetamido-2,6-beta-L-arabino-hexul-4-ose reductase